MTKSVEFWRRAFPPHTKVKSAVVAYYFKLWSGVVQSRAPRIGYLDLYAGRGESKRGEPSTAIKVLGEAAKDPQIKEKLVAVLNDKDREHCKNMESVIARLGYDRSLTHKPRVLNRCVDELLANELDSLKMIPTLCFIDPYGFKGVSISLIRAVLKDWGCDVILFFHTSGINRNLTNPDNEEDLQALFGPERFARLRLESELELGRRDELILGHMCDAVLSAGAKHAFPLRFNFRRSKRISHHLLFITKHDRGFNLMKKAAAKFSDTEDSVPTWTYTEGWEGAGAQLCLRNHGRMADLRCLMQNVFRARSILFADIVAQCDDQGLLFTEENLKNAILQMEEEGKVSIDKPAAKRMLKGRITLGKTRMVTFES